MDAREKDRLSRRGFLLLGAAGLSTLVLGRWKSRRRPPPTPPPPVPLRRQREGEASCFLLGDVGTANDDLRAVVRRMGEVAAGTRDSCVVLLGDNFYQRGVASTSDPLWESVFERSFDPALLPLPFFAALGNHDHQGSVQAQLDYVGPSRRWNMPRPSYSFRRPIGAALDRPAQRASALEFFVLDTTPLFLEEPGAGEQVDWLARELPRSDAAWKVVVGHHPIRSGGNHGATRAVRRRIEGVLDDGGADLYASGHDHDLQLLESGKRWLQVVSGAGSAVRPTGSTDGTLYAEATPGFVWLLASERELLLQFVTARGEPGTARFSTTLRKSA